MSPIVTEPLASMTSGFLLPDPRPDVTKYKDGQPCMKNCDVPVKIIGKARDIDVTPDD